VAIEARLNSPTSSSEYSVRCFSISQHEDYHLTPLKDILKIVGDEGARFRQDGTLRGRAVPNHQGRASP
jgi:hypothetical protein